MKECSIVKVLFITAALGLLFCLGGAPAASAKPIQLSYACMFPPTHIQSKLPESWCREVEKRTNGAVEVTYYPGGTLLGGAKIFSGVLDGIADAGTSVIGYTPGIFPAMQAIDLPMGYPNAHVATKVINDFYNEFKPKSFSKVKVLYLFAHGPGILHSKKPVRKLEDLNGMKIRSYGFSVQMAEALGGVPVAMPQSGAYEALQKGVAEATIAPMEVLKGWKQAEVVDYTTECYDIGYTAGFFVVMNLDKWNSLPKEIQQTIEEINEEWVGKYGDAWANSDREGKEYALSQGNEMIPLSEEESARWVEAVSPVVDQYVKDTEAKGLPGQAYVDFIRAKIKEYSK
ncbi:MAG: TRAP transporter substrate-binding protein [Deltaproteobacteria bacterium]|nr:TRAP transporter substrate-binding protein [Deltaproteobacteria bacterium]